MQYNTELEKLKLPEFGRNIQKMVEHCKTIPDREERQHCAETIVEVMARIYPEAANKKENHPALWNQLAALSDYTLDIDFPVEIVAQEDLHKLPMPINYPDDDIVYRHYGHITQQLITVATNMPEGAEKNAFIELIARHMKNTFLTWGHSSINNERIVKDLKALSNGELLINEEQLYTLLDDNNSPISSNKVRSQKGKRKR